MFMRKNRTKNGAAQPEQMASKEASEQRAARKLSPNDYDNLEGEDWRFSAQLGTCEGINNAHYEGGVSGDGPYKSAYESHIPFVGNPVPSDATRKLKGQ